MVSRAVQYWTGEGGFADVGVHRDGYRVSILESLPLQNSINVLFLRDRNHSFHMISFDLYANNLGWISKVSDFKD